MPEARVAITLMESPKVFHVLIEGVRLLIAHPNVLIILPAKSHVKINVMFPLVASFAVYHKNIR